MRNANPSPSKSRRRYLRSALALSLGFGNGVMLSSAYAQSKTLTDEQKQLLGQLQILPLGVQSSPFHFVIFATTDCSWCRLMLAGLLRFAAFARISVVMGTISEQVGLPLLASLPHVTDPVATITAEASKRNLEAFSQFALGLMGRGDLATRSAEMIAAAKSQDRRFQALTKSLGIKAFPTVLVQGSADPQWSESSRLPDVIAQSLTERQRMDGLDAYANASAPTAQVDRSFAPLNVAAMDSFRDGLGYRDYASSESGRHLYIFFDPADARSNLLWYATQPFFLSARFHWVPICDPDDAASLIRTDELLNVLAARPPALAGANDADPDEFRWRMLQYRWKEDDPVVPSKGQLGKLAGMRQAAQRIIGPVGLPAVAYLDVDGATTVVSGDISSQDLLRCIKRVRQQMALSTYDIGRAYRDAAVLLEAENNAAALLQRTVAVAPTSSRMREFGLIEVVVGSDTIYCDSAFRFFLQGTVQAITKAQVDLPQAGEVAPVRVSKSPLQRLSATVSALKKRQPENVDVSKKRLEGATGSQIASYQPSPLAGWNEVVVDEQILYVSFDGQFVFTGSLITVSGRENLTEKREEQLRAINFDQLPFDRALVTKYGTGGRRMAIVVDPYCQYCQRLERTLAAEALDLTVYRFIVPILGEESRLAAERIYCDKDPLAAWQRIMATKAAPPKSTNAGCGDTVTTMLALGKRWKIKGTPTMFFQDGTRLSGATGWPELDRQLSARSGKR